MARGLDVLAASVTRADMSFDGYGFLSEPCTVTPRPYQRPFLRIGIRLRPTR